ncbi:MAG: DNA/pantothenate metabolism flavoprotein [Rariglobus sp.]|jgi:phosphopantothenoylcysteine decarboxylase/phosphopantothenate--cysteine ligase|nr:DNA/pantothenate metabolism flavoprotein [Rariglobus sp.]
MRILLTSGATREPIDAVRFLSNVSTGRTGALLAGALAQHDHAVTLLHGEGAVRPGLMNSVATESFSSTENLEAQLRRLLGAGSYDAVIHCAAVSDYRPAETHAAKLTSYASELTLRLVPTTKLLPKLKHYAPRPLKVIGFKLTAGAGTQDRAQAVAKLFAAGTVDAVIHNDMDDLATGDARPFHAWRAGSPTPESLAGIEELGEWLNAFVCA